MPTVTIKEGSAAATAETPSAQIVRSAHKEATVTDVRGRVLTVRRMTALAKMRLIAFAGPELARNEQWVGMAALASSVVKIDGDAVTSNTVREVEFIVDRLDDDGLEAVASVYQETFGISAKDDTLGQAKN